MKAKELMIKKLGKCKYPSPLNLSKVKDDGIYDYISEKDRILFDDSLAGLEKYNKTGETPLSFEKAGPREKLYFNPSEINAAIVTCGGLCPGINDVIRSLVMELHHRYNINKIFGAQYGYWGLVTGNGYPLIDLTTDYVSDIHLFGGSKLGSSRGKQSVEKMVDTLEGNNIRILFTIGGDGTLKGAHAIHKEIERRGLDISIAAVPKTIDNDVSYIEQSFGFETAFTIATEVIRGAHNEAKGAYNGIAIVKLMGRDSGFISAHAAVAMPEVNFVLIPEMHFDLYGKNGFLEALKKRLDKRHHAVVVVSEGAGQYLFDDKEKIIDESGNVVHKDIGLLLKHKVNEYFEKLGYNFTIKYIDPSYTIRSAPATANDSMFCTLLAQNSVHGTMAGKTDFVTGTWHSNYIYLPIPIVVEKRKKIDLESADWWYVLETTGQPTSMKNER